MAKASNQAANGGPTTDRMATAAHDTVDRVARAADRAEREVRRAATRATRRAKTTRTRAVQRADASVGSVRSYIEDNPVAATGIAFAAGLVLAGLLRR
jgi:ElaB/YqjD/DUF883 family membrane-anchored ribosome-binding protein